MLPLAGRNVLFLFGHPVAKMLMPISFCIASTRKHTTRVYTTACKASYGKLYCQHTYTHCLQTLP